MQEILTNMQNKPEDVKEHESQDGHYAQVCASPNLLTETLLISPGGRDVIVRTPPLLSSVLTEAGVNEAVPHAAPLAHEPAAAQARGEAKRGPEHAHQHVAHADVQQEQVHRRAQRLELAKEHEHQQVVEEAEGHDEAQDDGHHVVPGAGQHLLRRVATVRVQLTPFRPIRAAVRVLQIIHHLCSVYSLTSRADGLAWRRAGLGFLHPSSTSRKRSS